MTVPSQHRLLFLFAFTLHLSSLELCILDILQAIRDLVAKVASITLNLAEGFNEAILTASVVIDL